MLTSQIFEQHISIRGKSTDLGEINRLLAAAVVSRKFCALLLSDPHQAIAQGYEGEQFFLSPDEYHLVLSAQGSTLQEFAKLLCEYIPERPVNMPAVSNHQYNESYLTMV
jgi:hypothetical protein